MTNSKEKLQYSWYERIKIAREFTGKSQIYFCEKLGCSQNMFSIIEKGDLKNPKKSNIIEPLKKMLVEEGISKTWLNREEGEMSIKVIQEDYRRKYESSESENNYLRSQVEDSEN